MREDCDLNQMVIGAHNRVFGCAFQVRLRDDVGN